MLEILTQVKSFVLDTLFPINCLYCGQEDVWLCEACQKNIELLSFQKCPLCEKTITESGTVCRSCKADSKLDGLLVATHYKDNQLSKLIHLYKYKFIEDLHLPLGKLLVRIIAKSDLPLPDMLVPVPLHPRRLRWRGFNQSALLADYIGKNLTAGFEITIHTNILHRKRYTPPQMKIKKYAERIANLQQAFSLSKKAVTDMPSLLQGKTILLVDDVATTGTTLFECAKILKAGGAKKVFAVVIARQEME